MVTITLPLELEQAVTEQAQRQEITPETLALNVLNQCFLGPAAPTRPEGTTLADTQNTALKTDAEYEAEFEQLLKEMDRIDAEMAATRAHGERLQAESRAIAARTDARLDELEKQLDRLQRRA